MRDNKYVLDFISDEKAPIRIGNRSIHMKSNDKDMNKNERQSN